MEHASVSLEMQQLANQWLLGGRHCEISLCLVEGQAQGPLHPISPSPVKVPHSCRDSQLQERLPWHKFRACLFQRPVAGLGRCFVTKSTDPRTMGKPNQRSKILSLFLVMLWVMMFSINPLKNQKK
jgi:hypothetical protein